MSSEPIEMAKNRGYKLLADAEAFVRISGAPEADDADRHEVILCASSRAPRTACLRKRSEPASAGRVHAGTTRQPGLSLPPE